MEYLSSVRGHHLQVIAPPHLYRTRYRCRSTSTFKDKKVYTGHPGPRSLNKLKILGNERVDILPLPLRI